MSFDAFGLHPKVAAGVRASGFTVPTPIQREAIPHALAGRDLLGLAQTGTGKTAAFALPILHKLLDGPRGRVRALVLAPTRELAEQIHQAFRTMGKDTGLRSATVYGGVGMQPQIKNLKGRAEIVVACPGRLLDHCGRGSADLTGVEILVLDEADQMFDMGFALHPPDLRRLPAKRQTMLFSATMPGDIRGLAHEILRDPAQVQVSHDVPLETVAHALFPIREHLKGELLLELLRRAGSGSVLVFTRTKHRAKRLGQRLKEAGISASSLQGNLSQNQRKAAMDGFRDGSYQVLVATDIAARGIDVSQVTHVINFDVPVTPEAYTHRIGRTGRAARTGDAFTLTTDQDGGLIQAIERHMKRRIDRRRIEGFDYDKAQAQGLSPLQGAGATHGGHAPHGVSGHHGHNRIKHPRGGRGQGRRRWGGR